MTYLDPAIKQIKYGDELQPDEVDALLRYAIEHRLDPKGEVIRALSAARDDWVDDINDRKRDSKKRRFS